MMFKYMPEVTMKRRSVMMIWKRNEWKKTQLPSAYYVKWPEYFKVFQMGGMKIKTVRKLLIQNQAIFEMPLEEVKEVFLTCYKRHVDMTTLSTAFFNLPDYVREHRIMLLEEMGVRNIHAALISNYTTVQAMRMGLFKAALKIPKSVNMTRKIVECLEPFPPDVPPLETLSEDLSVKHFRVRCWQWYLKWRLNLSEADNKLLDPVLSPMGSSSFRIMKKHIDILYDDIGVTAEQILRKPCLGKGYFDELEKTIETVKTFGGIELKKIIRVKPVLYRVHCDNAIKVKKLLQNDGVTDKMKRLFPEILLLPHKEVKKRIDIINNTPELRVLKANTRSLMLVKQLKVVQIRLEYLRHHNVNHATVRALTAFTKRFEKLLRTGVDYTTGKEIGMSFSKILNLEREEISRRIKVHPYWRTVGIASMHDVVALLLEHFSAQDIGHNIPLILYPKERIAEVLNNLPEMKEVSKERKLSGKQILATCLYELERECHFSGDGIWRRERPQRPRRKFREQIDAEEAESLGMEEIEEVRETLQGKPERKRPSIYSKYKR